MQERDVITLSEGLDYLLVSEIEHESEKYFLAMISAILSLIYSFILIFILHLQLI